MGTRWMRAFALAVVAVSGAGAFSSGAIRLKGMTGAGGQCRHGEARTRSARVLVLPTALRSSAGRGDSDVQCTGESELQEARLAKLLGYAKVFSEEGSNGDMRKYNVQRVAMGDEGGLYTKDDRMDKARSYSELFGQGMTGISRAAAVRAMQGVDDSQTEQQKQQA